MPSTTRMRTGPDNIEPTVRMPLSGFAPMVGPDCRAVVLGSFPSAASLQAGHYYAHRRNQFWPIIGRIIGCEFRDMPYVQRYRVLQEAGLGLWDVIAQCERPGSLDSAIRRPVASQLSQLHALSPTIQALLLNGRKAQTGARRSDWGDVSLFDLPSTSPANAAMSLEVKLEQWRAAIVDALG